MLHLLIDTCVWLDLAKDYRAQPAIAALDDLIGKKQIALLVPQVVVDEFQRNKARVIEDSRRSLQSHFKLVRDAINRFGDDEQRAGALKSLNEVDHKIATGSESVIHSIDHIEKLLTAKPTLATTDAIKRRVTDRALAGHAPYHRSKNSVGDAILIETYADAGGGRATKKKRFGFITHNVKDFSDPNGDRRLPHPDIANLFSPENSNYWVSLADLIKEEAPDVLEEHDFDFNYSPQSRRLSEILEAENLLFRQVWYNRHWSLRHSVETGKTKVLSKEEYSTKPYKSGEMLDSVWARALAAAKRTEDEVGLENLGPWDDFEWGMVNGKLSALRWILGDDWDMLDT